MTKAIGIGLRRTDRKLWRPLTEQARDPQATQDAVLRELLDEHRDTVYGRSHGFADIQDAAGFAASVPISTYEDLRPFIERQERTDTRELTSETPVLYAQTSGTTGAPKLLPITPAGIDRQKKAQRLLAAVVGRTTNIFAGKILGIGSPAIEGHLDSGKPYGSASGLIFDGMPALIRSRYLLSDAVVGLKDHDERYFRIARAALLAEDLTAIGTANPSTIMRVHDTIVQRWDELVDAVGRVDPDRGRAIARVLPTADRPFEQWWPELAVVTTWTGGSCGLALDGLADQLPASIKIFDLGYSASELRGSVPVGAGRNDGVPLLGDVYFEFAEQARWEAGDRELMGLADIEVGKRYYLIITTIDGLYRYDMNNIVEVVDRFENTPTITFVQKGKGATNITGEKLYESQVIAAMRSTGGGRVPGSGFFLALADPSAFAYRFFVEGPLDMSTDALADRLDAELKTLNVEYDAKRTSGRLHAPVVEV